MSGRIFWITGLPGSGKTTLSRKIQRFFRSNGVNPILLDGDDIRIALGDTFGYTKGERLKLGKIYINLARMLEGQGHVVIVSTVSLMQELHDYRKSSIPRAFVIFINAQDELLNLRNQKQLRDAATPNSPGINLSVEYPDDADCVLFGNENEQQLEELIIDLVKDSK